jgi:hypothetical protein
MAKIICKFLWILFCGNVKRQWHMQISTNNLSQRYNNINLKRKVVFVFLQSSCSDDTIKSNTYLTVRQRRAHFPFDCVRLPQIESETFIAVKVLLGYDAVFLFRVEHTAYTSTLKTWSVCSSKWLLRSTRLHDVIARRTVTEVYSLQAHENTSSVHSFVSQENDRSPRNRLRVTPKPHRIIISTSKPNFKTRNLISFRISSW